MANSLVNREIVVEYDTENSHVKLTPTIVKQYIVGNNNITMPEFKFFTELCKARKLNPFLREAYCVKYGNNSAQLIVSKDVFLKRAIKHPQYDGMESGIIVQNIKTKEITERKGLFWLESIETVVGGWAKVYRKDWTHPTYVSVSFNEVSQKKGDGSLNSNWSSKQATMVEKVAKVRALRETFIDEFSQMYANGEIVEEDTPIVDNQVNVQIQPQETPTPQPQPQQPQPEPNYNVVEEPGTDPFAD